MGKRCIHYASQDGPIHIQSGTGFMTLQALQGVTKCRGLEPAICRLWGKGVSITLASMEQFLYNLGMVLCDSTSATNLLKNKNKTCKFIDVFGPISNDQHTVRTTLEIIPNLRNCN